MTYRVHNIEIEGVFGTALVFENEYEAEAAMSILTSQGNESGTLICCNGYYNALWREYSQLEDDWRLT